MISLSTTTKDKNVLILFVQFEHKYKWYMANILPGKDKA